MDGYDRAELRSYYLEKHSSWNAELRFCFKSSGTMQKFYLNVGTEDAQDRAAIFLFSWREM